MKLNNIQKFLQTTAQFCYGTATLSHSDSSVDDVAR